MTVTFIIDQTQIWTKTHMHSNMEKIILHLIWRKSNINMWYIRVLLEYGWYHLTQGNWKVKNTTFKWRRDLGESP